MADDNNPDKPRGGKKKAGKHPEKKLGAASSSNVFALLKKAAVEMAEQMKAAAQQSQPHPTAQQADHNGDVGTPLAETGEMPAPAASASRWPTPVPVVITGSGYDSNEPHIEATPPPLGVGSFMVPGAQAHVHIHQEGCGGSAGRRRLRDGQLSSSHADVDSVPLNIPDTGFRPPTLFSLELPFLVKSASSTFTTTSTGAVTSSATRCLGAKLSRVFPPESPMFVAAIEWEDVRDVICDGEGAIKMAPFSTDTAHQRSGGNDEVAMPSSPPPMATSSLQQQGTSTYTTTESIHSSSAPRVGSELYKAAVKFSTTSGFVAANAVGLKRPRPPLPTNDAGAGDDDGVAGEGSKPPPSAGSSLAASSLSINPSEVRLNHPAYFNTSPYVDVITNPFASLGNHALARGWEGTSMGPHEHRKQDYCHGRNHHHEAGYDDAMVTPFQDVFLRAQNSHIGLPEVTGEVLYTNDLLVRIVETLPQDQGDEDDGDNDEGDQFRLIKRCGDGEAVRVEASQRYATLLVPEGASVTTDALVDAGLAKLSKQQEAVRSGDSSSSNVSVVGFSSSRHNPPHPIDTNDGDNSGDEGLSYDIVGVVRRRVIQPHPATFTFAPTALEMPTRRSLALPPKTLSQPVGKAHLVSYSYKAPYHQNASEIADITKRAPIEPLINFEEMLAGMAGGGGGGGQQVQWPSSSSSNFTLASNSVPGHEPSSLASLHIPFAEIPFNGPTPTGPPAATVDLIARRTNSVDRGLLQELVEKADPTTRLGLVDELVRRGISPRLSSQSLHIIIQTLNTVTYTFSSGPFRAVRFLFGVDPRRDGKRFALHQRITFRITHFKSASVLQQQIRTLPHWEKATVQAAKALAAAWLVQMQGYVAESNSVLGEGGSSNSALPSIEPAAVKARRSVTALRVLSIDRLQLFLGQSDEAILCRLKRESETSRGVTAVEHVVGDPKSLPELLASFVILNSRSRTATLCDVIAGSWPLTQLIGEAPLQRHFSKAAGYFTRVQYAACQKELEAQLVAFLRNHVRAASQALAGKSTPSSASAPVGTTTLSSMYHAEEGDDVIADDGASSLRAPSSRGESNTSRPSSLESEEGSSQSSSVGEESDEFDGESASAS